MPVISRSEDSRQATLLSATSRALTLARSLESYNPHATPPYRDPGTDSFRLVGNSDSGLIPPF